MKTEDILNIDCTNEENKRTLNRFLWKVKPVAKLLEKNNYTKTEYAPIEILEQSLHGISIKYRYMTQGISVYYNDGKFIFYNVSVMRTKETNEWIGNVYGKTLWETIAKTIIKIYADIMKERKEE